MDHTIDEWIKEYAGPPFDPWPLLLIFVVIVTMAFIWSN